MIEPPPPTRRPAFPWWLPVVLAAALAGTARAQSRNVADYALFAGEGLLANGVRVIRGGIGVNQGTLSSAAVLDATDAYVVADSVQLNVRSTCGALFANALLGRDSPGCGPPIPFATPIVPDIAAACGFPNPVPTPACDDGAKLVVDHGQTVRLQPGVYGDVVVAGGIDRPGTLVLAGGDFRFCSIRTGRNTSVLFDGPARVYVRDVLSVGNASETGPTPGAPVTAKDIQLFADNGRVHLARNATMTARVCAPTSKVFLIHGVTLEGSLVAQSIRAGRVTVQIDHTVTTTSSTTSSTTTTTSTTSTTTSSSTSSSTTTSSTTSTTIPRCGDGVVQAGEECDDGNQVAGNCCAPDCHREPDGQPCGPRDACSGDGACQAGVCVPPTAAAARACVSGSLVAFVTNFDDDTVSFLTVASSGAIARTAAVGDGPWGVALNPAGTELYVTNRLGSSVTVVDPGTGGTLATIPVGTLPLGVIFDPTGVRAYVVTYKDGMLSTIDPAARRVVATTRVGRGPSGLAFGPGGTKLYVSNYAENTVVALDPGSGARVATIHTARQPLQMALDEPRGILWVVAFDGARVSAIGTFSDTLLASVPVGKKPFGIAVDSASGRVYVSNAASDTVSVIDETTCTPSATVPVHRAPFGVGLDLGGTVAYVANASANDVTLIDTAHADVSRTIPVGKLPVAFGGFIAPLANTCARAAASCDDANPVTLDSCVPAVGCQHVVQGELEIVRSALAALQTTVAASPTAALGTGATPAQLVQLIADARAQLAPDVTGKALRRGLRRVGADLAKIERTVRAGLRRRTTQCDPGLRLLDLARGARRHARLAAGGRVRAAVVAEVAAPDVPPPDPRQLVQ